MRRALRAIAVSFCALACKSHGPAPFPREVAGFRFGISPEAFQTDCARLGRPSHVDMQSRGLRVIECNGVEVQPGWRWSVFAGFCESGTSLCEISYTATSELSVRNFETLEGRFTHDYGAPAKRKSDFGARPTEEQCAKRRGTAGTVWVWSDAGVASGSVVVLLDCRPKSPAASVLVTEARARVIKREYAKAHPEETRDAGEPPAE